MIYDFVVEDNKGKQIPLNQFKGKVLLIVNTATGCGFTPQYEALQKLYDKYKEKGFEILDFPCNQFLGQAPGSNEEIQQFCKTNYNTTFHTFSKVDVNGTTAIPLFDFLKSEKPNDIEDENTPAFQKKLEELKQVFPGKEIKWNFTKFLVDRTGTVVARYAPTCEPKSLEKEIEKLL